MKNIKRKMTRHLRKSEEYNLYTFLDARDEVLLHESRDETLPLELTRLNI